ncbi:MAG: PBP1A family penicillin-binding protein [Candidatus Dadabacteria bacterium]|nr:MAG: PBP1A family penicillin-binding protein [Candidatus Dadabacteria bacterium]
MKFFKILLSILLSLGMLSGVAACVFVIWGYFYITRDLPKLDRIEDYEPPAVTTVYDRNGTLIAEFYRERRYPIPIEQVPQMVRNCFLAAEDASFYSHPGIDLISIIRAMIVNIESGQKRQGGSTITQQVVKKLLLSPEKDYRRKIKEAILAYRLEKKLSKDDILEIYLNHMYFGEGAYGIKAAAKVFFHKDVKDLTLGEAAILAGLVKAPSRYSPVRHFERAKSRQKYVLRQLIKSGFADASEVKTAEKEKIKVYPPENKKILAAPYFVDEIRRILAEQFGDFRLVQTGGYTVYTTLDLKAQQMAKRALKKGLEELDKRQGWRGPLMNISKKEIESYVVELAERYKGEDNGRSKAVVVGISHNNNSVKVNAGFASGWIKLNKKWLYRRMLEDGSKIEVNPIRELQVGSVIEISFRKAKSGKFVLEIDQTPEVEGAIVVLNPNNGKVVAMVGGYDYSKSQFNRVTQSKRQPGSAFKPIVYLTAIDGFGYTPATIVYDEPRTFRVGDELWTPSNFDDKFLGPITLRTALEKSRNLASVDLISRIGADAVISYARKMGITSDLGSNLSLSLGSSEVSLLEMARAYGVFAARGMLFRSVFIDKVVDRNGNVVFDAENEIISKAKRVINENSAFVMANMMKGVVQHGTGVRVRPIGRPVAGKTGTSNDQMDAWFIGYTPEWVCGVWVGFDVKKTLGEKETGGRVAAPIWLYFMKDFLQERDRELYEKLEEENRREAEFLDIEMEPIEEIDAPDFVVPDGVDPFWIDKTTGIESCEECENAFLEYFIRGTKPNKPEEESDSAMKYLQESEL